MKCILLVFTILFLFLTGSSLAQDSSGVRVLGRISGDWDEVNDVALQDEYAFLVTGSTGLQIIDCSDPEEPELIGSCDTPGNAMGITVVGDYAYLADFREGLRIIDISDPENPEEVGSCDTPGRAHSVAVWGDYAYIADGPSGVRKIDISDPENPEEPDQYGFLDTAGDARDVYVTGGSGYIADYGNGIILFDSNRLYLWDEGETQHLAYGVVRRGGYIYVADCNAGIVVLDMELYERGSFNTEGSAYGLSTSGNYVYVADGEGGLRVLDISDDDNPDEIGFYDTPGEARRVEVSGNIVYLADGDNLGIYDCERAINNQAPNWTEVPDDRITADEGDNIEFSLTAEDENDDELTIEMESDDLPDEAEFTDNEDGSGDFEWQTRMEDADEYEVIFIVSDGDLNDTFELTIIVSDANEPPIWVETPDDTIKVYEGQSVEFYLIAEDPNDDDITIEIDRERLPDVARFTDLGNGTGIFTWHTNQEDAGVYHPAFIVSDGEFQDITEVTIIINDFSDVIFQDNLPNDLFLLELFPNPFNSVLRVGYALPKAADVMLSVYDLYGRSVAELVSGRVQAGFHTVAFDGSGLASGVYMLRYSAAGYTSQMKVVLVK